jgi:hypothetical protein
MFMDYLTRCAGQLDQRLAKVRGYKNNRSHKWTIIVKYIITLVGNNSASE